MVHNATVTFPLISNDGREEKTKNLLKNIISKNKRKKKKIKINEFNLFKKMEKRIDERVRAELTGRQRYKTREATVGISL